jgi:hypothetical protein
MKRRLGSAAGRGVYICKSAWNSCVSGLPVSDEKNTGADDRLQLHLDARCIRRLLEDLAAPSGAVRWWWSGTAASAAGRSWRARRAAAHSAGGVEQRAGSRDIESPPLRAESKRAGLLRKASQRRHGRRRSVAPTRGRADGRSPCAPQGRSERVLLAGLDAIDPVPGSALFSMVIDCDPLAM